MKISTYKNKSLLTKKKAFTLIELLIVIAIIGILFIVLISKVDFATDKAKATGVQTDFRSFQVAIETVAKENAGLATFGWDTGDTNGNRIRDSYDKGDTNKNGKQDPGEVFVGSKTYGETWTNIYTLTNPADENDTSAIAALEAAINANLDPKLHIKINDDLTITMSNGAQDPWNTEYHGYYITNAVDDNKDRGAIVIYSNGANQEFGSEHSVANGIVTVNVPGNNVKGKDDYSMAVIYTYVNGYGEVKTVTTGFSNNQGGGQAGTGETIANPDDMYSKTYKFANNISINTLEELWNKSIADTKDEGYVVLIDNESKYLELYMDDAGYYGLYYARLKYGWHSYDYYTNIDEVDQLGWHECEGEYELCSSPYISFAENDEIYTVNGVIDLMPLLIEAEEPQPIFQTDIPYVIDMDYIVFKDDGTFIVFYDAFASDIIEGGNDIALQKVDLDNSGWYEWYMDAYGIEWVRLGNFDIELEVTSLIKSDKTYHDVYQNQKYNTLLMDCSKSKNIYQKCQHSTTMSLTYINYEFIDDSANVFEWFKKFYIYNNIVFDIYDAPIGYVSMDGQYIEIFYDCNHYFLSKRGETSRTPDLIPVLNEHGFYENVIYEVVYYDYYSEHIIFFNNGLVESSCIRDGKTWTYDSNNDRLIILDEDGDEYYCTILSDSQILINDSGYEITLSKTDIQRKGYYLEKLYVDEYDDMHVICHADGSVTVWYWNARIRTIQTNMISEFSRYFIVSGDCSVTFSEDGTFIEEVYWYE